MSRRRGAQDVCIFNIQDRRSRSTARKPWVVRWQVDGNETSRAHRTKTEADRFRSRLLVAQQDGERFDRRTGLPLSWLPSGEDIQLHVWARRWVAEQWPEWQPRTRREDMYSLARFLPLACDPRASDPPVELRSYLCASLPPDAEIDDNHECEKWLNRWCLTLGELDRTNLATASQLLGMGDKGQQLASETTRRYRRVAHSCIRRAVELEQIAADPWPPTPRGRSRRKVNRTQKAVDVRRLPGPASVVAIVQALRSHQPGSRNYQMMSTVVYYAGLRPSEAAMLRPRALHLPDDGWGSIAVVEADDGWDEPVEPKTGNRTVPIPPRLVELLRSWITEHELGARRSPFPHPRWSQAVTIQLVPSTQASLRRRRSSAHPPLRPQARRGDAVDSHRSPAGRGRTQTRPQRRDPGVELHRCHGGRRDRSKLAPRRRASARCPVGSYASRARIASLGTAPASASSGAELRSPLPRPASTGLLRTGRVAHSWPAAERWNRRSGASGRAPDRALRAGIGSRTLRPAWASTRSGSCKWRDRPVVQLGDVPASDRTRYRAAVAACSMSAATAPGCET